MKDLYVISYDNFYMSKDIVTLDNVPKMINAHMKLEQSGMYSGLFNTNDVNDYNGYTLVIDGSIETYKLRIHFHDDDDRVVTLHKATVY